MGNIISNSFHQRTNDVEMDMIGGNDENDVNDVSGVETHRQIDNTTQVSFGSSSYHSCSQSVSGSQRAKAVNASQPQTSPANNMEERPQIARASNTPYQQQDNSGPDSGTLGARLQQLIGKAKHAFARKRTPPQQSSTGASNLTNIRVQNDTNSALKRYLGQPISKSWKFLTTTCREIIQFTSTQEFCKLIALIMFFLICVLSALCVIFLFFSKGRPASNSDSTFVQTILSPIFFSILGLVFMSFMLVTTFLAERDMLQPSNIFLLLVFCVQISMITVALGMQAFG